MSPASYQTAPPRVAPESGKRDSNPRPQPWQGCALPTELFPRTNKRSRLPRSHGGEGNRTPDLLNAIQALSQLSYTPGVAPDGLAHARQEPRRISKGSIDVKKFTLAKSSTASILQRFENLNFSITQRRVRFRVFRLSNQHHPLALLACKRAAFA